MKDRIIEMLERKERVELECVDPNGFDSENPIKFILKLDNIIIKKAILGWVGCRDKFVVDVPIEDVEDSSLNENSFIIFEDELKYFKIKEPSRSFNDLIDTAVQAWKDGVLKNISFEKGAVDQVFTTINGVSFAWCDGEDDYSGAIDTIRLIYTESFIIKTVDDIFNIKWKNAKALLQNGNEIELDMLDGALNITTTFKLLKGATVTQKRGNQCNK